MRKLIVALMVLISLQANAGFNVTGSMESNQTTQPSVFVCQTNSTGGSSCKGYKPQESTSGPRVSIGYETKVSDVLGLDLNLSTNDKLDGRIDSNLILKVSDKVSVKAGPNLGKSFQSVYGQNSQKDTKLGFQVGAEYKLKDNLSLTGQVTQTNQSVEFAGYSDKLDLKTNSVSVGIKFNF